MSWKVTINYKLIDMYDNGFVLLSIKRNTGFILNEAIFHNYTWDEFNTTISITSFIDESYSEETVFEQGEQNIKESINIFNEEVNRIKVISMKTRWGSCNVESKNINLNLELIKKPRYCIEYVILHELAHLKYPNHRKQFWEYMSVHMPNWKWRKEKLESIL